MSSLEMRQSYIKEAYKTLRENNMYNNTFRAIKELNNVCYEYIYNETCGSGEIHYPEMNRKIVYSFKKYKPPMIRLSLL